MTDEINTQKTLESAMTKRHVLVVDDDRRLRHLLSAFLRENDFVVTTASDASEARDLLAVLVFDLIVLDVMMKGETGIAFLQWLRKIKNSVPVLLLTAQGEAENRIVGLEAGADDYLTKPFQPKELVLRLQAILRRFPQVEPSAMVVRFGAWQFNPERDELVSQDEVVRLSSVEAGLLRTLAEKPGTIFSRDALCASQPLAGNARTIDVQVTRLRRKIEIDPRQPRYLVTIRGEGYVLRPDD